MAYSSNEAAVRGFIPPQNEDEKRLMHRVEELCNIAQARMVPRYTSFLSDREQILAGAAMNRCGCGFGRFWGGCENAERKVLCLEPPDAWQEEPIAVLKITTFASTSERLTHRDLLGATVGLGIDRRCLGDILLNDDGSTACVFVLENKVEFVEQNLTSAGHCTVHVERCEKDALRELKMPEPRLCEATVPSLRADAVLAAMMHTSRAIAAQAIAGGKVEVNHVPLRAAHETVYVQDVFTVRGTGRYRLQAIGGKSKKDRIFVSFYQY